MSANVRVDIALRNGGPPNGPAPHGILSAVGDELSILFARRGGLHHLSLALVWARWSFGWDKGLRGVRAA